MSDKEKIIDKVRKLLNLSKDNAATEGEIENAIKFAQRLITKHNIDEKDIVFEKEGVNEYFIPNTPVGHEGKYWQWTYLQVIGDFNNVRVLRNMIGNVCRYRLIGFDSDIRNVISLYEESLMVVRSASHYRFNGSDKTVCRSTFIKSYLEGFCAGLRKKLQKDQEQFLEEINQTDCHALMVVKKDDLINDYIQENLKVKTVKQRQTKTDFKAYFQGHKDGEKEITNKQIK